MELIVVLVIVAPIALAIWLIVRAVSARNRIEELARRLGELESEVFRRNQEGQYAQQSEPAREPGAPAPALAQILEKQRESTPPETATIPPEHLSYVPLPVPQSGVPFQTPSLAEPVIPSPQPEIVQKFQADPSIPPEPPIPPRIETVVTGIAPPPLGAIRVPPPAPAATTSAAEAPTTPAVKVRLRPPVISSVTSDFERTAEKPSEEETAGSPREIFASSESAVPPPIPGKGSFEMRLGTYWLVRVGIVMLLTGLVFFGNYAYHNFIGKLGPGGKVSLLYFASALLLGAGAWWQRKPVKESLRNYGQVLFAGGLAAVYFTTYAAHHITQLRVIESAVLDGALLLAWAGFIAWIADRRKSEALALFAVGLAYYTSVITRVGSFTLYSNLVLTLAAVFFLVRNRWATLSFVSVVATYAGYAFWRFFHGGEWRWATPEEGLWFGAYFLMSYWVAFTAAVFLSKHEKLTGGSRASFLTLNNGAFFTLFLLTMLQVHTGGFWKFSLAFGAVLLALCGLAKRVFATEPIVKNSYLTQGLLLVTVGLISKFADVQLALILAAESVVLLVLGTQRKNLILQAGAYLAAAMSVGWGFDGLEKFDRRGLCMGAAVGALMVFNAFWSCRSSESANNNSPRPVPAYFTALALMIWAVSTWQNTSPENLPLAFGIEALLLTIAAYFVKVPELALLGQGYVLLAQFALLSLTMDTGRVHATQSAALQLALATAAEGSALLVLGKWRQSLGLRIGGYVAAALAIASGIDGLEEFNRTGLFVGAALGAVMVFNAHWWRRSASSDRDSVLQPVPAFYTILALVIWISTTWFNTTPANFSLALAIEALLLTMVIYLVRVPEIPLLGQSCLVLAQLAWQAHVLSPGHLLPWWNPLLMIAITLSLSRWWQLQKVISIRSEVAAGWQFIYGLGIVALLFNWLHPQVDAQTWLAIVGLLGVAVTAYGVTTRLWLLAACGQILVLVSGVEFAIQLGQGKPLWFLPLTPIVVFGSLSYATVKWFQVNSPGESPAREPLLLIALFYRWMTLVMSAWWVCEYIPERERVWVFMTLGVLVFLFAGWRRSREAALFGAAFTVMSLTLLWLTPTLQMRMYAPNLIALLAFLAQQQIARRLPARYALPEPIHGAVIVIGCLSLWRYLSCWVASLSTGGFYLTASWSALALVLFGCGLVLRERIYRWVGLGVLAGALGRVVVFDVWKQERIYQVLTFTALGLVLLVLGFIYNKYQEKIREWL